MKADRFNERAQKPEAGNKYYITKANGGYSSAIEGKPVDKDCNVLSNCVGYAYGRFNEIGEWGACKYLSPVNAGRFMQFKGDCQVGFVPQIGACMVWENEGTGHVAIVERVVSDTEVVTSESAWGGKAFYTKTRKKGENGNWDFEGRFLGFIYNPAPCCKEQYEIKIGDIVDFSGSIHYLSPSAKSGSKCKQGKARVTNADKSKPHPYHLKGLAYEGKTDQSNVWGWVDVADISIKREENITRFLSAAISDGISLEWSKSLAELSAKCLVQQWTDKQNRYPELTKLAQELLGVPQTGVCDGATTKAIKDYQAKNNLKADGGIGRKTWELLLKVN